MCLNLADVAHGGVLWGSMWLKLSSGLHYSECHLFQPHYSNTAARARVNTQSKMPTMLASWGQWPLGPVGCALHELERCLHTGASFCVPTTSTPSSTSDSPQIDTSFELLRSVAGQSPIDLAYVLHANTH